MNRISRLRWWWMSVWSATLAAFGRRPRAITTVRWNRPGPPPDLSKIKRPAWLQPDDELGVATSIRSLLLSDDGRALGLVDCVAYSNGFEFTIAYRSRTDINHLLRGQMGPMAPGRELEVSIDYPDGGQSTSADRGMAAMTEHYEAAYEGKEAPEPKGPIVMPHGGGGGGNRYDMSFWCWPLPPEGPIRITVQWVAAEIAPTSVEIDASPIRRAGLASAPLWSA